MRGTLIFYMGMNSIRGALVDGEGLKIAAYEEPVNLIVDEEYVEQDPSQWLEIISRIIRRLQKENPHIDIENISVTYEPGAFVCIDRSGDHIMNAIMPCDRRAQYQARACEKRFKKHSEGFSIPWDSMIYPRILWIKHNKPDIYRKVYKILTPDGFIAYKLCGETAIDSYSASFLGYNIKNGGYSSKIISNSQLDPSTFPDVCKTGECIGIISGTMRDELELKSDVKFIMASNCLVPLSFAGCRGEKTCVVYDARTTHISFINTNRKIKRHAGLIKFPYEDDDHIYSIIGDYESLFLDWIFKLVRESDMDDMDYNPGDGGVITLPHMMGEGINNITDLRGGILGIKNCTNPYDLIASCFKSMGYALKERIEKITGCGIHVDSIEVLGCGKSELFYHILADITEKRIIVNDCEDEILKSTWCMINNIKHDGKVPKKEILPCEDSVHKYRQLFSLYKSTRNSLDYVFKCRRKIIKDI